MNNLTKIQKNALRWFVEQIDKDAFPEEFYISFSECRCFDPRFAVSEGFKMPKFITRGVIEVLHADNYLLFNKDDPQKYTNSVGWPPVTVWRCVLRESARTAVKQSTANNPVNEAMNNVQNPYLGLYEELLEMADKIQKTYKEEPGISGVTYLSDMLETIRVPGEPVKTVDGEMYGEWLASGFDLIRKTLKKESPHYISFDKHHSSFLDNKHPSYESFRSSLAILKSARSTYEFDLQFGDNETAGTANNNRISRLSITRHFNAQELRALYFDIGLEIEEVPINETGKSDVVIHLIKYAQREGKERELEELIHIEKPHLRDLRIL